MNQAQIDFQQLRIKHILFKSKVRSVLYGGTYDADFFSNQGPINAWFNAVGISRYHSEPTMLQLRQVQKDLTTTAENLFALYNRGKIEEAHAGLSAIDTLSEKFLSLLSSLEGKLAA